MKKEYRIKDTNEFQRILNKRKFVNSRSFTIYFVPKKEAGARLGIAVSKKNGNAVLRNKTKRQIRNIVQDLDFNALQFDGIILVRKNYFAKSFDENRKDLENLVKTVKIEKYVD